MLKKIALITLASLALGGCSLKDMLKTDTAVTDENQETVMMESPVPTYMEPDEDLDGMKQTSSSTEVTSLESDVNNTVILEEDFSDLN
jgi:hypothetical protein